MPIGKGRALKPYEFCVKATIIWTLKDGLVIGTRTLSGNSSCKLLWFVDMLWRNPECVCVL